MFFRFFYLCSVITHFSPPGRRSETFFPTIGWAASLSWPLRSGRRYKKWLSGTGTRYYFFDNTGHQLSDRSTWARETENFSDTAPHCGDDGSLCRRFSRCVEERWSSYKEQSMRIGIYILIGNFVVISFAFNTFYLPSRLVQSAKRNSNR